MKPLRTFVLGLTLCGVTLGYGSAAYAQSSVAFTPSSAVSGSSQPTLAVVQNPCGGGSFCAAWIAATAAAVAATAAVVQAGVAVATAVDSSSSSSSSSGSIHFNPPTRAEAAAEHRQYVAFMERDFDK